MADNVPVNLVDGKYLHRVIARDYRETIAGQCYQHVRAAGPVAMVLYDVTTLHFETDRKNSLRKVGMSNQRRVDCTGSRDMSPTSRPPS